MENQQLKPKTSPRDVFMHLLAIGTLYASAISFIALLFQHVNRFFPDPLAGYESVAYAVRWPLSILIIVFPVFVWVMRFLEQDARVLPEKREMAIRKWLLYLTLFIAALTIIGDLVTLVYNYLGGDLTARFLLKILAVLFVAGAVFAYYIWDLRRESAEMPAKMKRLAVAIIGVIGIGVIGGFFIAGPPQRERLRRFDERRVSDLQSIQYQVIDYWQRKERLPESLADLRNDISGYVAPLDPDTQTPYVYRKRGDLSFELCASFSLDSREASSRYPKAVPAGPYGPYGESLAQNWEHGVGEACFNRTIDPELYKPYRGEKIPPPLR